MQKLFKYIIIAVLSLPALIVTSCEEEEMLSKEAEILTFGFENPAATGVISGVEIKVEFPFGTDVKSLTPTITISPNATISPAASLARDFTNPVDYVVTAEDGKTEKIFTVTTKILDPTEVTISEFSVPGSKSVEINQATKTIKINIIEGSSVNALVPAIKTIPASATVDPASGVAKDFTNPVNYVVTQGATTATYVASVNFVAYGFDAGKATVRYDGSFASSTLPAELGSTGDNERGFSMNSNFVYVADKGDGKIYYYKSDGSSSAGTALNNNDANNTAIVAGGTFKLSDVIATEKGIVASNMTLGGTSLRIYKWKDNAAPAELLLDFPAVVNAANVRLGDAINFVGDPYGTGKLYVMPFANGNYVLIWDIVNGAVTNASTPTKITFQGLTSTGNYGYVEPITSGGVNYFLVNGANMVPNLWTADGATQVTNIKSDAIIVRVLGGKIVEFNDGRYLCVAQAGTEGSTIRDAGILVYDITGGSIVDAMNAITVETVAAKKIYSFSLGQKVNGNQAADVDVYIDTANKKLRMFAGAANNGFRVVEAPEKK